MWPEWTWHKLAERTGLEPATPGVTGRYSNQLNYRSEVGACCALRSPTDSEGYVVGGDGIEPADPLLVRQMLSQLS